MRFELDDYKSSEILGKFLKSMMGGDDREGKHPSITDLTYCLTKTFWDSQKETKRDPTDKTKMYFTLGLGLEQTLLQGFKSEVKEGEVEGIWFHPDVLDEDGLMELKTTRMAPTKAVPDQFSDGWMRQIKGYLYCLELLDVIYVVMHLIQAELRAWRIHFEPEEIQENWKYLLRRKEVWDQAEATGNAPKSYTYNQGWECRDCVYSLRCEALRFVGRG